VGAGRQKARAGGDREIEAATVARVREGFLFFISKCIFKLLKNSLKNLPNK
jgi:hypothetical protein